MNKRIGKFDMDKSLKPGYYENGNHVSWVVDKFLTYWFIMNPSMLLKLLFLNRAVQLYLPQSVRVDGFLRTCTIKMSAFYQNSAAVNCRCRLSLEINTTVALDLFVIHKLTLSHFPLVIDSSIGMANRYGLDGLVIKSRWGRDFSNPSRPVLVPTWPPT